MGKVREIVRSVCGMCRTVFVAAAAAWGMAGCTPAMLWSYGDVVSGLHPWDSGIDDSGPAPQEEKDLYVTGVEYPAGYVWRDSSGSDTECTIFLMRNGKRIAEVTVRPQEGMSADPDMHRCSGGRLYVDYVSGEETVVLRENEEMFRIPGREYLRGFLEKDGRILSVSCPREGGGWTYRENGVSVSRSPSGFPLEDLYEDGGRTYFRTVGNKADGTGYLEDGCCFYLDGDKVAVNNLSTGNILDFLMMDGKQCVLSSTSHDSQLALGVGDDKYIVQCPKSGTLLDAHLVAEGGHIAGVFRYSIGFRTETRVWKDGHDIYGGRDMAVKAADFGDDGLWFVTDSLKSSVPKTTVMLDYKVFETLPEGYELVYPECMAADGKNCCIALSDVMADDRPALWTNGKLTDYDFNGFFTSVRWQ